jgi:hypothetical protein
MQHRRIQQQRPQMRQEGPLQPPRRAAPDPGRNPVDTSIPPSASSRSRDRPTGRWCAQVNNAARAVVSGPIRTGEPGAAAVAARRSPA